MMKKEDILSSIEKNSVFTRHYKGKERPLK